MASLQQRTSRGKKYWSIVESRRVNGKPRSVILQYLGTAETLLSRLSEDGQHKITSFSHGDTGALLNIAEELDVIGIINKHVTPLSSGKKPIRDGFTVGASCLLAGIGRSCRPTSKLGWYEWGKETSLSYCLGKSLKKIDSQHFWDQMDALSEEKISDIEDEIVRKLVSTYDIKLDRVFFDTSNFFSFIDSSNDRCDLPQRGKNKQKRYDLRQVGLGLLVSRKEQFPLFHRVYRGNKNDVTVFKEVFDDIKKRLRGITDELSDITIIFDKGNNSKENFAALDEATDLHYVGGLVSSHFLELIEEANKNFTELKIKEEVVPVFRIKREIWGAERTCVITVSKQLKDGQIRGIEQHLKKKYAVLEKFKQSLENPQNTKKYSLNEIATKLNATIKGQFIDQILKFEIIEMKNNAHSFTYFIDSKAYEYLLNNILGRKILVTNQHLWTNEDILLAYRGQSKVEYAFRNLKNPMHLAIRPQFHWTDQKIAVHFFICILGYLLTIAAYTKAKTFAGYERNIGNFLNDLRSIRLAGITKKRSSKISFELESYDKNLAKVAEILGINNRNLRTKINFSDYKI